ncbi:hypothetical protein [Propionivibrio sp.]|uniref:hypothetical protein n=1 Tax=Propionivibrio sp. TaxID=2212460 RepID=UPI003BF1FE20
MIDVPSVGGERAMGGEKDVAHAGAPKIIYTIMPDFGGAYSWTIDDGIEYNGVGICNAAESGWYGQHPISQELHEAFVAWQKHYEEECWPGDSTCGLDWEAFHCQGLSLARRLKAELGDSARVIYEAFEDTPEERREILADGSLLLLPNRKELGSEMCR